MKNQIKNKIKKYDWIPVLKLTKVRFLETMHGNETQDSFLVKLLNLYDQEERKKNMEKLQNE